MLFYKVAMGRFWNAVSSFPGGYPCLFWCVMNEGDSVYEVALMAATI